MTTTTTPPNTKGIYVVVGVVIAVLLVVMVALYNYNRANHEAVVRAEQLIAAYHQAGLRAPLDAHEVARILGDDGGTVCAAAGSREQLGYLKTQIGVGGEFYVRPVILQPNVYEGLRLIVTVYCPENLSVVNDFISEQNYTG
ncbi:MAG: hypothetical protein INR66_11175 [Gordonia polyisoprenivorans]|nr:hypothetical protein [Gordonia polyisoprenivorans]